MSKDPRLQSIFNSPVPRPKIPNVRPMRWVVVANLIGTTSMDMLGEVIGLYFNKTRDEVKELIEEVTGEGWSIIDITTFDLAETRVARSVFYAKRHLQTVSMDVVRLDVNSAESKKRLDMDPESA